MVIPQQDRQSLVAHKPGRDENIMDR